MVTPVVNLELERGPDLMQLHVTVAHCMDYV